MTDKNTTEMRKEKKIIKKLFTKAASRSECF